MRNETPFEMKCRKFTTDLSFKKKKKKTFRQTERSAACCNVKFRESLRKEHGGKEQRVASHPGLDVRVVIVADVINREDRAVFLRVFPLGPEAGEVGGARRWHAQHHHRRALVIVNQGPKLAARVPQWPFRYDVLPGLRVTLSRTLV